MPATSFYCNWCRASIGTYHDATSSDGPFVPDGAPPGGQTDHLRTGVVARTDDGSIVSYPCPHCGRSNLLQLPHAAER